MLRRIALVVALVLLPVSLAQPYAWGAQGHHIIARIALSRLTPDVQRTVTTLLAGEDFVTIATWADEVRSARPETYNWHFVDVPYGQPKYDAARDCAPSDRGDCVIAAIDRLRKTLADANAPMAERRDALKFIVHFVGDLHQPLHTIENKDRGGNDVRVNGDAGRVTNLHSIWDSGAISKRGLDEAAYAKLLMDDLGARPIPASEERVDVVKWAEDGHRIAEADVYRYPEFVLNTPPTAPISLPDAYFKRAQDVIDRQIQLGGVHLAALLNETLRGSR